MKRLLAAVLGMTLFASTGCSLNIGMKKTDDLREVVVSQKDGHDKILLLTIDGMISLEPTGTFLGKEPSMVASLREQLDRARGDRKIKGVIVRINSPGGTLGATQMIHDELTQYRKETGVYVLSLFLEVAASGALYLSMASDHIMAYPSALTGSMGVLFISPNFQELGKKIGIEYRVVKTGARKDMGTPFRSWPPEEHKMLENLAAEYNEQFKSVVFNSRKSHGMTKPDFEILGDARVVSAEQAQKLRLIDEVGNINAAILNIEKKNDHGRMKVVAYTRYPDDVKTIYSRTYGLSAMATPLVTHGGGMGAIGPMIPGMNEALQTVLQASAATQLLPHGFYYLWR